MIILVGTLLMKMKKESELHSIGEPDVDGFLAADF